MKNNCSNKEKVKREKEEVRREESPAGAAPRSFAFLLFTFAFLLLTWPAIGRSQDSSRRDRERMRREYMSGMRPSSGRSDASGQSGSTRSDTARREAPKGAPTTKASSARPGTPEQAGRITKPAEPNVAPRPVERRAPRRVVQDEQWKKYEIITQRNMFSRLRVPVPRGGPVVEPPKIVPNPESYLLLKGVAQENNQFIAFVEDKRTGSVLRLREGDPIARGRVKSLNLDGLEYEFQGKTTPVRMGSDLEGGLGAVTAADLASLTPLATPAGGSAPAPTADEAEILKRLMEKRQQEMGK